MFESLTGRLGEVFDRLRKRGADVVMTREPGGTALAEKLREMVLHSPMDPLTEALLAEAVAAYERTGQPQRSFLSVDYQAESWPAPQPVRIAPRKSTSLGAW